MIIMVTENKKKFMIIFNEWHSKDKIKQFIKKSTPQENGVLHLYKGKESSGWITLYFRYDEKKFEVFTTLAAYDLSDLVDFFENIIDFKEESALFLENEIISTPLLYAAPMDNQKIRFLIADGERTHNLWKDNLKNIIKHINQKCKVM